MSLRAYIAGLVLAVASVSTQAAPIAYGEALGSYNGHSQGALFRVDLGASTATLVGPAGSGAVGPVNGLFPFNIRGLSFNPQGQLYAVSDDLKVLLTISRTNGAATPIGQGLNLSGAGVDSAPNLDLSMAFTCDGKAWLASGTTGNFWSVDTSLGTTTLLGNFGSGITITGLAAHGSTLYATGSQASPNLYVINTTGTPSATLVGAYGGTAGAVHTVSPGFDTSGQLWAILDNIPNYPTSSPTEEWSNLAHIDDGNGAMTSLGAITGPASLQKEGIVGLAIAAPTCTTSGAPPEPQALRTASTLSAGGLLMLGLMLLAAVAVTHKLRW